MLEACLEAAPNAPNLKFACTVANNGSSVVDTYTLNEDSTYGLSERLYDSMLRAGNVQPQTPSNGGDVTDTVHNTTGRKSVPTVPASTSRPRPPTRRRMCRPCTATTRRVRITEPDSGPAPASRHRCGGHRALSDRGLATAGGLAGAEVGASIGALGGPVGAVIGGVVGGIAGGIIDSGVAGKATKAVENLFHW